MAITSFGYPGTIDAKTQAVWLPMVSAAQYSVAGAGDLRVSARTGADRGLTVAAGTAAGDGVMDIFTTPDTSLALPSVSGSNVSRWFMVVLRRNWNTNTTTLAIISGSATRELPARQNTPGGISDQPLALCRVESGKTTVAEFVDLRTWGRSGGMFALDDLVKGFLTEIGTTLRIGSTVWERTLDTQLAPVWRRSTPGGAIGYSLHGQFREPTADDPYIKRFTIPDPGFPYVVQANATVEGGGGGSGTRWDTILTLNGSWMDAARGDAVAPWWQMSGNSSGVATGALEVGILAIRQYGNGPFGLSAYNQLLSALIMPAL